jgi:creatinine amidohydrolase
MADQPHILASAHYRELKSLSYDCAVLPWGATEPHNLHLPYGTDTIEAATIAAESARIAAGRGARVIVLPAIPYGVNTSQLGIPLTINMNPGTQKSVLADVIDSLEHHGVTKLAILNGHGGNEFKHMIRELQPCTPIFLCFVNWWVVVDGRPTFDVPGDHAGELETSVMMHIAGESVLPLSQAGEGAERAMRIRGFREGWAWAPRDWTRATRDAGTGNPKAATAEKGKRYFEAVTAKIGDFLAELSSADLKKLYEGE